MSTDLARRSGYTATSLSKASANDVKELAENAAKVTEITYVANHEIAQVGVHAVGTMAHLIQVADSTQRQLTDSGHRSEIYDDAQSKVLQVTGQNVITMANTAQKEILQQAASAMR